MRRLSSVTAIVLLAFLPVMSACAEGLINPDRDFRLDNGLRVILIKDTRIPMVHLSLVVKAGSEADSPDISGRANLAGTMLRMGSKNYTAEDLAEAIDSVGGTLETMVYREFTAINGDFLSRDFDLAVRMISDVVINPNFDEEVLEQAVRRQKSILYQMRSLPNEMISIELYRHFYPGSGYGLSSMGTMTGVANVTIGDIKDYYDKYFKANNAALIIIGDFATEEAIHKLGSAFGGWSSGKVPQIPKVEINLPDTTRIYLLNNPSAANTEFIIGHPASPVGSDDFPKLVILSYLLGGGGEISRLQRSLIEDRNLALNINSALIWSRREGMLLVTGSAVHSMAADAITESLAIIERLRTLKIPANEIKEAISFYKGYLPMYLETAAGKAAGIDELLGFGVGLNYFDKLFQGMLKADPSSLRDTAQKYFKQNEMIIVACGPAEQLKSQLSQIGPVEIIEIGSE